MAVWTRIQVNSKMAANSLLPSKTRLFVLIYDIVLSIQTFIILNFDIRVTFLFYSIWQGNMTLNPLRNCVLSIDRTSLVMRKQKRKEKQSAWEPGVLFPKYHRMFFSSSSIQWARSNINHQDIGIFVVFVYISILKNKMTAI